jgi:hypothetical protein
MASGMQIQPGVSIQQGSKRLEAPPIFRENRRSLTEHRLMMQEGRFMPQNSKFADTTRMSSTDASIKGEDPHESFRRFVLKQQKLNT